MKKDYIIKNAVELAWIRDAIRLSKGECYQIDTGLATAYLIDFSGLRYGRVRRRWLLVVPEIQNEWSTAYHAMLTDSDKAADEFVSEYDKQQDSYNDEDSDDFDPEAGEYRYYPAVEGRWFPTFAQEVASFPA